jgi:hypothetical protein
MSNVIRRGVKRVVHFLLNRVGLKLMARPIRRRSFSNPASSFWRRSNRLSVKPSTRPRSLTSKSGWLGSASITNGANSAPRKPGPPADIGWGMLMYGGIEVFAPTSRETIEPILGNRSFVGMGYSPSGKLALRPVIM